ncbi:glutamate-cysteine ligase family protein [Pseudomonas flexibilis]|uniref:Glutamate-cysteine ligase family 2(GCS2) n=1 Tax=Pseudomonas flexibilis TaxID=706570 RepID=A0A1N6VMJ4_9PSED|nr:glutamate-cysteine ligase family protein [Pseudomonas flexibilis]SIQ79055.1 Glutamate-cysteine ligase family 2(GCS2) [Pseudomonas flexibilis]
MVRSGSAMRYGIEFEYLLIDASGPHAGRIRDFTNLDFSALSRMLAAKPGLDDPTLATGDQGIRSGYWYLEGDERAHPDGRFAGLAVKGVEIRTPPRNSVAEALDLLLEIERQLAATLATHHLALGIAALNPLHERYVFDPPLNTYEQRTRAADRDFAGNDIATLTFGPDLNLSFAERDWRRDLDAARKLNFYAPFIVPFSFDSPWYAGQPWTGWSRRTWMRCGCRPAVRVYVEADNHAALQASPLMRPARLPGEVGRIEFKAFDAAPGVALLAALCQLLTGLCLDDSLPGRSEEPDVDLYRLAALDAFDEAQIAHGAQRVLRASEAALQQAGLEAAAGQLEPLWRQRAARTTPAHALRASGQPYWPGGLAAH